MLLCYVCFRWIDICSFVDLCLFALRWYSLGSCVGLFVHGCCGVVWFCGFRILGRFRLFGCLCLVVWVVAVLALFGVYRVLVFVECVGACSRGLYGRLRWVV